MKLNECTGCKFLSGEFHIGYQCDSYKCLISEVKKCHDKVESEAFKKYKAWVEENK